MSLITPANEKELFYYLTDNQKIMAHQVSRALIGVLIEKGLSIHEKSGKYYLDPPVISLSGSTITKQLNATIKPLLDSLNVVYETLSTNSLIHDYLPAQNYSLLLAEYQQRGHGRRDRSWESPLAANIYMSLAFNLTANANLNFIPLISAVSICKALNKTGIEGLQIKWPNDVYLDGKKLGGILIEGTNRARNSTIICGIGLNVNMQINREIDQKWTSLSKQTGIFFDRNAIIADLVNELINAFNQLERFNYQTFIHDWMQYDYLYQKPIIVSTDSGQYEALVKGLAQDGSLLVECIINNKLITQSVYAADVSVKPETYNKEQGK